MERPLGETGGKVLALVGGHRNICSPLREAVQCLHIISQSSELRDVLTARFLYAVNLNIERYVKPNGD